MARWASPRHGRRPRLQRRLQVGAYLVVSVVAVLFTALLLPSSADAFDRFYAGVPPLAVVLGAGGVGAASLIVLRRFGFVTLGAATLQGIGRSAIFATVLAAAIAVADVVIRYPEDLNVPLPEALLFYPAIGFTAEVVFHLLPLALLIPALELVLGRGRRAWSVGIGLGLVATAEPTFQVLLGSTGSPGGDAFTWLHIFVIASLQLHVFRRYGFVAMYGFRLIYYVYWHLLWGTLRLEMLF